MYSDFQFHVGHVEHHRALGHGEPRDVVPATADANLQPTLARKADARHHVGCADAANYQPMQRVDLVVCCEVLEHAADWAELIEAAASWLNPGGRLIVTCAGPGRPQHSAHDGGSLRPGEHYANITAAELCRAMQSCGIWIDSAETLGRDTRASGTLAG